MVPEQGYDIVIIGAGIVGLATAMEMLVRYPSLKLAVLEKEHELASQQTGHNSGVIHSGIYYTPGSLKAKACVAGESSFFPLRRGNRVSFTLFGENTLASSSRSVPRPGQTAQT